MTNTTKAYGRVSGGTVYVQSRMGDFKKQRIELSVTDGETRVKLDFMLTGDQLMEMLSGGTVHAVEFRRFAVSAVDPASDEAKAVTARLEG